MATIRFGWCWSHFLGACTKMRQFYHSGSSFGRNNDTVCSRERTVLALASFTSFGLFAARVQNRSNHDLSAHDSRFADSTRIWRTLAPFYTAFLTLNGFCFVLRLTCSCHGSAAVSRSSVSERMLVKPRLHGTTRYNRLSSRLNKRLNVCIHDTTGCQTDLTTG